MDAAVFEAVRFDRFVLHFARGVLLSIDGQEVTLRPKAFALLRLFVENAGRLLDHDTIVQAVWAGRIISDDGITQCVRDIRRALGDDRHQILRTIPRRGYVLAAEVTNSSDRLAPVCHTSQFADKPSVAVFPFANLSNDLGHEFFSDGIASDIIIELSRNRSLFVIANSNFKNRDHPSADSKKLLRRKLGARYLLDGTVRHASGRARINAQLVDAESGSYIWTGRYDVDTERMLVIQDDIARAVVAAIQPAVADAEFRRALRKPAESLSAWEAYQHGLWHIRKANREENDSAKAFFQRAISLEPMFAPPHTAMAIACMNEGFVFGTCSLEQSERRAIGWARRAVDIDPNDADAHAILAWATGLLATHEEAQPGVDLALSINPNSSLANAAKGAILLYGGQRSQAREALSAAQRLDPFGPVSAVTLAQIACLKYFDGDYRQAAEIAQGAVSRYPDSPASYRYLAASLGQLGRLGKARKVLQRALDISPQSIHLFVRTPLPWLRSEDREHILDGVRRAGWGS
jgi:adenylate cyclase